MEALSQVAACPEDGTGKKRLLMSHVAKMVDADRWVWSVCQYNDLNEVMSLSFLHGGFSEKDIASIMQGSQDPAAASPEHAPIVSELMSRSSHFTRRRDELVPDVSWTNSPHVTQYRRRMGIDECLWSIRPLDDRHFAAMGFHRLVGRPAFSAIDSLLVHVVFSSPAIHTLDVAEPRKASDVLSLPPRLRTTLGLLLEGYGRLQIAEHLEISPNTVAEYMSGIYRHFQVKGQRDLMRMFRSGDGNHRPRKG